MCPSHPEEVIESEDIEVALVPHVQQLEDVLQRCRLLPVIQSQNKVHVRLIFLGEIHTKSRPDLVLNQVQCFPYIHLAAAAISLPPLQKMYKNK
jgi:hypothetical protein